ncbi:MAG TPA: ABC transporter permease, partial [Ginsengibacter sp.]|nr:ABC transporter permease [Ginsengibacter sp.]
ILATLISILQMKYHFIKLYGSSFLIDYFPVKIEASDLLLVTVTAFIIAFIASWFPAQKAASQHFDLKTT